MFLKLTMDRPWSDKSKQVIVNTDKIIEIEAREKGVYIEFAYGCIMSKDGEPEVTGYHFKESFDWIAERLGA